MQFLSNTFELISITSKTTGGIGFTQLLTSIRDSRHVPIPYQSWTGPALAIQLLRGQWEALGPRHEPARDETEGRFERFAIKTSLELF